MKRLLVCIGLVAATGLVYGQVRHHDFLKYDDPIYIVDNTNLDEPLDLEAVKRAFATPYETNWIPLTWLSLHLDHTLYGDAPAGYLLTNVALHTASGVVLFLALVAMTGALWRSALVAAVFALHPLHVESVAWASERKDVLAGLFWMLCLAAWAAWVRRPTAARYAATALALSLGLLAKPLLVTLPFALVLLDYWPLRRLGTHPWREPGVLARALGEKLPLFALAAAASVVTFLVQRSLGAMDHGDTLPLAVRIPNALIAYTAYLRDAFWPTGLAVFYPHAQQGIPLLAALAAGALLLAVTLLAWRLAPARPWWLVGWLWFLGTLVPMIGLVQVGMQARADRYMYVPLIGLSLAVVWGVHELAARSRTGLRLARTAAVAVVVLFGLGAWQQLGHWRDSETLYERAIAVTDENFIALHWLAGVRLRAGDAALAEAMYRESARVKPRWAGAHIGIGNALSAQGRQVEAMLAYERGLRIDPGHVQGHVQLARALLDAGRVAEARGRALHALALAEDPERAKTRGRALRALGLARRDRADARVVFAAALAAAGDVDAALDAYEQAAGEDPRHPEAQANLGVALLRAGRSRDAERALTRAAELGADSSALRAALADAMLAQGRVAEAMAGYRGALSLDPASLHAANNLAWLLATSEDPALRDAEEAVRVAEAALAHAATPGAQLLDTLATSLRAAGRATAADDAARRALEQALRQDEVELADRIRARHLDVSKQRE